MKALLILKSDACGTVHGPLGEKCQCLLEGLAGLEGLVGLAGLVPQVKHIILFVCNENDISFCKTHNEHQTLHTFKRCIFFDK